MTTSAIAGYKGIVKNSTAAGGAQTQLAELRDWSIATEMGEIEATSQDSSGAREVIRGIVQWSGSAEVLHVQSDATHKAVFDVLTAGTKVDFEFWNTGSSSDGGHTGTGYFTNWELGSPQDDVHAVNLDFVGTGLLAQAASSS